MGLASQSTSKPGSQQNKASKPADQKQKVAEHPDNKVAQMRDIIAQGNEKKNFVPESESSSTNFDGKQPEKNETGEKLESKTQQKMESGFGTDFKDVRVHTGSDASKLADQADSKAFAHGQDVFFKEGEYKPGTMEGDALIAHELTHTVQQRGATEVTTTTNEAQVEQDANETTVGVLQAMLMGGKKIMPKLRGGLTVSRCMSDKAKEKADELTPEQKKRLLLNEEVKKKMTSGNVSFKEMDQKEGHGNKTFNSYHFMRFMGERKANWKREKDGVAKGYGPNNYHDCVTSFSHGLDALYKKPFKTFNYSQAEQHYGKDGKLHDGACESLQKKGYVSAVKDFNMYSKNGWVGSEDNPKVTHFKESPLAWATEQSNPNGIHIFGVSLTKGYHTMNLIVDNRYGGKADFYLQDQHVESSLFNDWDGGAAYTAAQIEAQLLEMANTWSGSKGTRRVKLFKLKRD